MKINSLVALSTFIGNLIVCGKHNMITNPLSSGFEWDEREITGSIDMKDEYKFLKPLSTPGLTEAGISYLI